MGKDRKKSRRSKSDDSDSSSSSSSSSGYDRKKKSRTGSVLESGAVLYGRIVGMVFSVIMLLGCLALCIFSIYAVSDYDGYLRAVSEDNRHLEPGEEPSKPVSKNTFAILIPVSGVVAAMFGYLALQVWRSDRIASFFFITALFSKF